jgi:hypothetical protein
MLGIVIPNKFFSSRVSSPLLPNRRIHEYAPTKGADMEAMMIMIRRNFFPLILKRVKIYAKGVPKIKEQMVTAVVT